jgi:hypothetical protein
MAESASQKLTLAQADFDMPHPPALRPIAVKAASPADGASVSPAIQYTFQLKTDQAFESFSTMHIEVATAPTLGQDGTLASEYVFQTLYASAGDAFPDTYTASTVPSRQAWGLGTYYWQASVATTNGYSGTFISPVYRLVVAQPQPAPASTSGGGSTPSLSLSASDAKHVTRVALKRRFGTRFTRRHASG